MCELYGDIGTETFWSSKRRGCRHESGGLLIGNLAQFNYLVDQHCPSCENGSHDGNGFGWDGTGNAKLWFG